MLGWGSISVQVMRSTLVKLHMSHKILKVQNDTQGQVRGPTTHLPTPTPPIAPLTEMSSGTHFLCILLV